MSRLEGEVRRAQDEILANESKFHCLQQQLKVKKINFKKREFLKNPFLKKVQELWKERAAEELKTYVNQASPMESKQKKSVRDQVETKY